MDLEKPKERKKWVNSMYQDLGACFKAYIDFCSLQILFGN